MPRALRLLCLTMVFLLAEPSLAHQPKVRVRVATVSLPIEIDSDSVSLQGMDTAKFKKISLMKEESLKIFYKTIAGQKIWFAQTADSVLRFSNKIIRLDSISGKIKIGIHNFPSPVFISSKNTKTADVILSLPLEKYLEGVIAGEMSASWPAEALKAQAVAARSYTLYQLNSKQDEIFQLEGDVLDQVYSLAAPYSMMEKIRQAVAETKNQVLVQDNKILKAFYHSDCGGETEEPQNVWGVSDTKFLTVKDKSCVLRSRWNFKIQKNELAHQLSEKFKTIESVHVLSRSPTKRVTLIALAGGSERMTMTGQELRQVLGFDKVKSTLFSLTADENSVTFQGRGSGHGSGLCQWGTRDLAKVGLNYSQILNHYYPNARLIQMNVTNQSIKL